MLDVYIKKATNEEIENLFFLDECGLGTLVPEHRVVNNEIIYKKETVLPVAAMFDIKLFPKICEDILVNLYKIKRKKFSSGIYSYINTEYPLIKVCDNKVNYISYLKLEFENIINKFNMLNTKSEYAEFTACFFKFVMNRFEKYIDYKNDYFSLLHGDFHIGNIVFSDNLDSYKIIDFEYIRYGMPELEIANFIVQLLDGGEYVEAKFKKYAYYILIKAYDLLHIDMKIVYSLFIPMLLFFRIWRSTNEVNIKQKLVKNVILNISEKYIKGEYDEFITCNSAI